MEEKLLLLFCVGLMAHEFGLKRLLPNLINSRLAFPYLNVYKFLALKTTNEHINIKLTAAEEEAATRIKKPFNWNPNKDPNKLAVSLSGEIDGFFFFLFLTHSNDLLLFVQRWTKFATSEIFSHFQANKLTLTRGEFFTQTHSSACSGCRRGSSKLQWLQLNLPEGSTTTTIMGQLFTFLSLN